MQDDEQSPLSKKPLPLQAELDLASIDELNARIARLREEIALCEQTIEAKRRQRSAADAVFGSRS